MDVKKLGTDTVLLEKIVAGGQALGTLESGKKLFVWGGLPGERVEVQLTKSKSSYAEGVVTQVLDPSPQRILPEDSESYLSTSPWQIMTYEQELQHKAQLIGDAYEMHGVPLTSTSKMYTDGTQLGYRNKVEFSWWWDNDTSQLDLAFFRRGGHGKLPVEGTSLARQEINQLARAVRDILRTKNIEARSLKTLLIRCNQAGDCVWQLYVKDELPDIISEAEAIALPAQGGEIIYSDPRSPASRITKRLSTFGEVTLQDRIHDRSYRYAAESFFQINLPVYEQTIHDIAGHVPGGPLLDMYSGVGSIGLSIAKDQVTLVEVDPHAYEELQQNIALQAHTHAESILAPSEKALDYITSEKTVIVDPPRAGLHAAVVERLLETAPPIIVYLSCNPVTQARDVAALLTSYQMTVQQGYNYFPRTPHIENLVVLERRN